MLALFLSNVGIAGKVVTVTATDLYPSFAPGNISTVVSLSFSNISGNPRIAGITITRTGTATDSDVPAAYLYEDTDQDGVPDGAAFDSESFISGSLTFNITNNKSLSTSTDWLISYEVAPLANNANSAGCTIGSNDIAGSGNTTITFSGFSSTSGFFSNDVTLPVDISRFSANVSNGEVLLKWRTESELNNLGFELIRSVKENGEYSLVSSFLTNISLAGQGNSNIATDYLYMDGDILENTMYWYKLVDVDFNGQKTEHGPVQVTIQLNSNLYDFELYPNYPNPFNPTTTIRFSLPEANRVSLRIYNSMGQLVRTLLSENRDAGYHWVVWDAKNDNGQEVAAGVYIYRITAGRYIGSKQMILVK
jgi:hypothetical protein